MRLTPKITTAVVGLAICGCAASGASGERDTSGSSPGGSGSGSSGSAASGSSGSDEMATAGASSTPIGPRAGSGSGGTDTGGADAAGSTASSGSGGSGSTSSSSGGTGAASDIDCEALTLPDNFDDVIATFEDATGATNQVDGRGGGFFMYNDGTGTQDPEPGPLPAATMEQRCGSLYALCTSGSGFTDWGAGMGTDLGPTDADGVKSTFDASEYSGIAFWARIAEGTTPAVRVSLKDANTAPEGGVCDENETSGATACNDDWGKALNLTPEWKPYTIKFDELRQAGWGAAYDAFAQDAIFGIQWQVGPNLEFDICIDDLVLVR